MNPAEETQTAAAQTGQAEETQTAAAEENAGEGTVTVQAESGEGTATAQAEPEGETTKTYPSQDLMAEQDVLIDDLPEKTQKRIAKLNETTDEERAEELDEKIYGDVMEFIENRNAKAKAEKVKQLRDDAKKRLADAKKAGAAATTADDAAKTAGDAAKIDVSKAPTAQAAKDDDADDDFETVFGMK